jgi:hypothetical protein
MTYITAGKSSPRLSVSRIAAFALRPFTAFWNLLIMIAEANPKMAEVAKLNSMTDADLAARGTSREAEVRRIFAGHFNS